MRGMAEPSLRNNVVFLTFRWTENCGETSKRPWFTKMAQEPNGMKLSKAKRGEHSKFRHLQFNNFPILTLFRA